MAGTIITLIGVVAAVAAVAFAAWQVLLAAAALREDRTERQAQRRAECGALKNALRTELGTIRTAIEEDLADYWGTDGTVERVRDTATAREQEGQDRYRLAYAWTPLLTSAIGHATREAFLLRLSPSQVQDLQRLQSRILQANALIDNKVAVLSALVQANIPKDIQIYRARPWAEDRALVLNDAIKRELEIVKRRCAEIESWNLWSE